MKVEEWLGEDNQLGTDIWMKKYCNDGESFDEWIVRISGGNEEIAEYIRQKKFLFGGRSAHVQLWRRVRRGYLKAESAGREDQ